MKNRTLATTVVATLLVSAVGVTGYLVGRHGATPQGDSEKNAGRKVLYWVAPMDPTYRRDKPGKSPMGMDLTPVYANGGGTKNASDVTISPYVVDDLGVRTAEVKQGTLAHRIETVGYVAYNEDTVRSVHTRADGWVERLAVKSVGDRVGAGQLLYELFSPKLATAEREYLTALASGSRSLIAASSGRLSALGFTDAQIRSLRKTRKIENRVSRRALRAGVVTELGVREGAYVTPATQVMRLADLSSVWVLTEVDERYARLLAKGDRAIARIDAFPGKHWVGAVDYVYPDINPVTRTLKVRVRFPNPGERLQPNMFARVVILARPTANAVYIPSLALIRTGFSQRVVVARGNGRFDVCPVQAGFESGDRVQILRGLEPGQRVVVSSQFLIDSEANLDAAALRMGSTKAGCKAPPAAGAPTADPKSLRPASTPDNGGRP